MKYELLYIIPGSYTDEEVEGIMAQVTKLLEEKGGKPFRNESLGKIKMAYPIKKMRHGTYVLVHFEADPSSIIELEKALRLSDEVLRHLVLKLAPEAEGMQFKLSSYVQPLSDEGRDERKPSKPRERKPLAPPAPAKMEDSKKISMEELDKKLDEILDSDVSKDA